MLLSSFVDTYSIGVAVSLTYLRERQSLTVPSGSLGQSGYHHSKCNDLMSYKTNTDEGYLLD